VDAISHWLLDKALRYWHFMTCAFSEGIHGEGEVEAESSSVVEGRYEEFAGVREGSTVRDSGGQEVAAVASGTEGDEIENHAVEGRVQTSTLASQSLPLSSKSAARAVIALLAAVIVLIATLSAYLVPSRRWIGHFTGLGDWVAISVAVLLGAAIDTKAVTAQIYVGIARSSHRTPAKQH
jgi:hypothetical protein